MTNNPLGKVDYTVDKFSNTNSFLYDPRDRLTNKVVSFAGGPSVTLRCRYNANGNLTNLWSDAATGVTNFYQHDALNRLTNVLGRDSVSAGYTFDPIGNLQTVRYGSGVTNLYQYDRLNRLTNAVWKLNASTLGSFYYKLGLTGMRTNLDETLGGNRTYTWQYDALYRLTNETINAANVGYGYDTVGNRTNRTSGVSGLGNQSFTFNKNDWQTSTDSYDNNGNTTGAGGNTYQYDVLNRLTNVNSGTILLGYDGDGNRVSKKVGGVTTYYLVDDRNPTGYAQVVEEYQGTTLTAVYTHGLDLVSQRRSGTVSYYIYDGHGSVRALTGTSGTVTDTYQYDAYGTKLNTSSGSTLNNNLYTGEQFDSDLGFYYLRARYYKPDMGRFQTMDSYEGNQNEPLSLHDYLYCHDNPANNNDPSGLYTIEGCVSGFTDAQLPQLASVVLRSKPATGHIVVHVWSYRGGDAWGHASMTLKDGTHISWWPKGPTYDQIPFLGDVYTAAAKDPQTFEDDCRLEGGMSRPPKLPDRQITITTLDEAKIRTWWVQFKTSHKWKTLSQNCSTTVADGLKAGDALDAKGIWGTIRLQWSGHNLVWTPSDVEAFANAIVKYHKP